MLKAFVIITYFWQGPVGSGEHVVLTGPVFSTKQDCERFRENSYQLATNEEGRKQAERQRIKIDSIEMRCVEFGK